MERIVGIYKITNLINNKSYIGQSRNILKRWSDHKSAAFNDRDDTYNYPLQRAIRKYGVKNFSFEVLQECKVNELNQKEQYWIKYYKPEYNQTIGEDFNIVPQKLTYEQVKQIQKTLMEDEEGKILHKDLAKEYNVSKDTIRDINVGRTWYNDQLKYPLHYSKYDGNRNKKEKNYCTFCGKEISKNSTCCKDCVTFKMRKYNRPSREELKKNIREKTQTEVASIYGVSRSTISRWSLAMNLPSSKTEIDSYTDEEWEEI